MDGPGRLYRALVEEQQVATGASGGQSGMKFEGMFSLGGTAKDGRTPEEVEQALYAEIDRLKTDPVEPERELQKVKNQNAAANFPRTAVQLRTDERGCWYAKRGVGGRPSTATRRCMTR